MKTGDIIISGIATVGAIIANLFGGWDTGLITLVIFMCVDYISGIIVAGVFHKSKKTDNGKLESRAGAKGLFRKGMILLVVLIATRLDLTMKTNFIRDAVVIGYIANETLSIIENAVLMGIPVPEAITRGVEILKHKEGESFENH